MYPFYYLVYNCKRTGTLYRYSTGTCFPAPLAYR